MRTKIFIFVIISLSILTNITPLFATTDVTGPTINSIITNKNSLYGGDVLTFSINASDDISGVENLMIEYRLDTDSTKHMSIEMPNNSGSNSYSYSYTMPTNTNPGLWKSYVIQIWDSAGNLRTYWETDNEDDAIISFANLDFTIIENPDIDTSPPTLNSISVKNKTISAPGLIEIIVNASDNKSTNLEVQVTYLIRGEQNSISLSKTSGTTYEGSLPVGADAKYSNTTFAFAILKDDAGNEVWYSYDPSKYPFGDASRLLSTNIDISYSNTVSDTKAPSLRSYSYSKSTVSVPGSFDIILDAIDDVSGIANIKIYFSGKDEYEQIFDSWILGGGATYNSTKKRYIVSFTFNQYKPNSTYYVTKITLTDGAGNSAHYSINPQNNEIKIEQKFLSVVKAIQGDIETGTMNDDYIDNIAEAADGSSISIDCTKTNTVESEVFDLIKGTKKQILLINDGIQWIFNGEDIINTTKSISTNINVYTFDEYGNEHLLDNFTENTNGLIIEFPPNGLLPGKALIKIKADYTFRNYVGEKDLYVYYLNEQSNGLEAVANKIEMSADGYYEFYITHNSKYELPLKRPPMLLKMLAK